VLIQKFRSNAADERVPIWIALFRGWGEVPENKLNLAFGEAPDPLPTVEKEDMEEAEIPEKQDNKKQAASKGQLYLLAVIIGFLTVVFATFEISEGSKIRISGQEYSSNLEEPSLKISATLAKEIATRELKRILAAQGLPFPSQHKAYADAHRSGQDEIYLVLKAPADHTAYSQLRNKYFFSDGWEIKFKRLKGSLDEKGESYSIFLTSKGDFVSYTHELPESRPGKA
jgi:hypothetical protein